MESLYVCLFSNGHIKVGRSVDPDSRVASHADRVACVGIDLVEYFVVPCGTGRALDQELLLISLCAGVASARNRSEWFEGLDYGDVCDWARHVASATPVVSAPEIAADAELIDSLGGPARVADLLKFGMGGTQRVQNWLRRGIPSRVKLDFPRVFLKQRGA